MHLYANLPVALCLFAALLFVLKTCLGSLARPSIVIATHLSLFLLLLLLGELIKIWASHSGFHEVGLSLALVFDVLSLGILALGGRREFGKSSLSEGPKDRLSSLDPQTWLHQKIRDERDFLQTIIDNTSSFIFAKTIEGKYLLANRQFDRLYAGGRTAVVGLTDFDIFPKAVAEQFHRNDREVFETGRVIEVEEKIPTEDGVLTFVSIKFPIRDTNGRIYATGGIATDISHLKRVEGELRNANIFLDSVIEHIPDMIFIKEAKDLRFVRFNTAGERLLGISRNKIIGKSDFELFPEEQAKFFVEKDREVLTSSGYIELFEEPINSANRGRRYLHTQKIALNDIHGEPEFLLGISRDITEEREAKSKLEQAQRELERRVSERTDELRVVNEQLGRRLIELEEAEEKFRLAIESAPNAMVMVDEKNLIRLVNAETERMFGISRDELLAKPVTSLFPQRFESVSEEMKGRVREANGLPTSFLQDYFGKRASGEEFPVEIGINPLSFHQGHYVLMAIVDVTDQKRAEEFMRKSLREKDLLLKEIHHRVKNNLQVISSLLKLQGSYLPDLEARRLFRQSDDRVRSMALIHERLYRSDGFDDIDFSSYIKELAEHLLHSYVMGNSKIKLDLKLETVFIGIDQAIPCGLMLNELVTNSLKHAFQGREKGKISIRLQQKKGDEVVSLEVNDDGVGLPSDFNLKRPSTLGMEIIRTLADQLNGQLKVESKKGTLVSLRFRPVDPRDKTKDQELDREVGR